MGSSVGVKVASGIAVLSVAGVGLASAQPLVESVEATDLSAFYEDAQRPMVDDGPAMSPQEARAEAEAQYWVATVVTPVVDRHPEQFSLLVYNADGTATVHFTGEVPAGVQQELSGQVGVSAVGDAAYSEREADEIMAAVHFGLSEDLATTELMTVADHLTGDITVAVRSSEGAAQAGDLLDLMVLEEASTQADGSEVPPQSQAATELLKVVTDSGLDAKEVFGSIEVHHDPTLDFQTEAINGGDLLTLRNSSTPWCTAGFPARDRGGRTGLTTAEHCTNQTVNGREQNRPLSINGGNKLVNPPWQEMRRSVGDVAYLRAQSGQTVNPRFRYDWGSYRNVWAHPVMGIDTRVCRFGITTGTGSGCTRVKYVSACYSVYCRLAATTGHTGSTNRDSGGPWYFGNNMYGVHSGSGTRDGIRVNYFTNSRRVLSDLGLTAMTRR